MLALFYLKVYVCRKSDKAPSCGKAQGLSIKVEAKLGWSGISDGTFAVGDADNLYCSSVAWFIQCEHIQLLQTWILSLDVAWWQGESNMMILSWNARYSFGEQLDIILVKEGLLFWGMYICTFCLSCGCINTIKSCSFELNGYTTKEYLNSQGCISLPPSVWCQNVVCLYLPI